MPSLIVRDGRRAAAVAAAAFFGWPARALVMVGVTGTNGKTTTVGLLRATCFIGTTSRPRRLAHWAFCWDPKAHQCPAVAVSPRRVRSSCSGCWPHFRAKGVRTVAMEVSSHALDQRRVEGISFAAGVFTNLTRDHLDYHGTMDDYRAAKLRLVGLLARDGVAVYNADDLSWRGVTTAPRSWTFGIDTPADIAARDVVFHSHGSRFLLVARTGALPVSLPLIGDFNVSNALAAASAALALNVTLAEVAERLSSAPQVPGRLERLRTSPTVLRDYAHTPDALDRALRAVRPFTRTDDGQDGRLIAVFGCGGDRDRGKRPEMGRIAESLADVVIVTSDNPRTEDPERILDDIEAGMLRRDHQRIVDRHEAIATALRLAQPADVIVLAGKGHETYQIRGTVSYPFDEREIVRELSATLGG